MKMSVKTKSVSILFFALIICVGIINVGAQQKFLLMYPNITENPMPNESPLFQRLVQISQNITLIIKNCWGFNHAGSSRQFRGNDFRHIWQELPVIPQTQCISSNELGNHLGYYLNDIACSDMVGTHFVSVYHKLFVPDIDGPITEEDVRTNKDAHDLYTFVKSLPNLIIHQNPNSLELARSLVEHYCPCMQYCWEDPRSPWLQRIDLVSRHMQETIARYINATHLDEIGTLVSKDDLLKSHDSKAHHRRHHNLKMRLESHPIYSHANLTVQNSHDALHPDALLPLVPNVTIQYRCGDNINFHPGKYGIVPFKVYNKRRILIETNLKEADIHYIYVLTESTSRSRRGPCPSCCDRVLAKLHAYLSYLFPSAVVLVKRGGDVFADYARIALSNVVFCSPSTLCLWPALANSKGLVYIPYTPLFAGATNSSTAPYLGKNKKFVDIEMVSKFEGSIDKLLAEVQ